LIEPMPGGARFIAAIPIPWGWIAQCRIAGCRHDRANEVEYVPMGIIWTIIIGFLAGVIAKFLMPGSNEPQGFILTAILGIIGAFVATYLGQAIGWYRPGDGAGLIGAVVGACIVLLVWGMIAGRSRPMV
jgi:uncharacterized membrane protein YeaQ/YmgE (transglycosylase-associated protein family)